MKKNNNILLALGLIAVGVAGRLMPHPWSLTPVGATAIFAGVKLEKRYAIGVPLLMMLISDAILGFYDLKTLVVVYASMMLIGFFSYLSAQKKGVAVFLGRPIIAAIFFFLTTNGAFWLFETYYPHTLSGLLASYAAGLPFLGHDLVGNLLYTTLFFGVYEFASKKVFHVDSTIVPAK